MERVPSGAFLSSLDVFGVFSGPGGHRVDRGGCPDARVLRLGQIGPVGLPTGVLLRHVRSGSSSHTFVHGSPAIPYQELHSVAPEGDVPGSLQFAEASWPADRHVLPLSATSVPSSWQGA
jgi:hypothetical protein